MLAAIVIHGGNQVDADSLSSSSVVMDLSGGVIYETSEEVIKQATYFSRIAIKNNTVCN